MNKECAGGWVLNYCTKTVWCPATLDLVSAYKPTTQHPYTELCKESGKMYRMMNFVLEFLFCLSCPPGDYLTTQQRIRTKHQLTPRLSRSVSETRGSFSRYLDTKHFLVFSAQGFRIFELESITVSTRGSGRDWSKADKVL